MGEMGNYRSIVVFQNKGGDGWRVDPDLSGTDGGIPFPLRNEKEGMALDLA